MPVLCLRYANRTFHSIYLNLKRSYKDKLNEYLDKVESDYDNKTFKFVMLCIDRSYSDLQNELFREFPHNPIMQFHIWDLREKFLSPRNYKATLAKHEERVGWQIERIYRARNQIVHAGYTEAYLESLGRNANEYFRATIGPVISRSKYGGGNNVDDVLAEFSLEYEGKKERLEKHLKASHFETEQLPHFFL